MVITQYSIVLVNLNPTKGSEINKTRPCVVISPNEINRNLRTVIVCPMTSKTKNYPTRVKVLHKGKVGAIAVDQIRTIDRDRIIKIRGKISTNEIENLKMVIRETLID